MLRSGAAIRQVSLTQAYQLGQEGAYIARAALQIVIDQSSTACLGRHMAIIRPTECSRQGSDPSRSQTLYQASLQNFSMPLSRSVRRLKGRACRSAAG